jgi:hypothetical protein
MEADGVSPRKKGVVAHIIALLEDGRTLIINGVISGIRVLIMWGKESSVREVAFLRNQSIHLLETLEIQIHKHLTLTIRFGLLGGDNKSLQADQYLLAEQRCGSCTLSHEQWGLRIDTDCLTVGGRVRMYIDALDSLYLYILDGTVKNWGDPSKPGTIFWAWRVLKEHAGCSSFPTQTHGNADAHLLIMRHLATRRGVTDIDNDWTDVDRQRIFHHYASLMTLDNQLNKTVVVYPISPGYSIDRISIKVPTLHGTMKWFKSVLVDCVLNSVEGGVRRDALSDALLGVISETQTWFNFFYAWHLRAIITAEHAWELAPPFARQIRVLMYSFVAICRLRNHTAARLIKLAVACQLLHSFMQSQSDRLFAPSGVTAVSGRHAGRDLTDKKTLWRHMLCGHLLRELMRALRRSEARAAEEGLEHFVGQLQDILRKRGRNWNDDLAKADVLQTQKQNFNARHPPSRSNATPLKLPHDPAEKGTMLMPTLANIRTSVVALLQFIVDQGWSEFIHYRGDVVFISLLPPPDQPWCTLQDTFDLLCGCSPSVPCVCHARNLSHPDASSVSRPNWLL